MSEPILQMINIGKKFVGTVALSDTSIELNKGEVLAILGGNGAGKSTLMKILSGVHPAGSYEGDILVDGVKCSFASPKDSEEKGIAMIPQEINLSLDLSVAENIAQGRLPKNAFGLVDWRGLEKRAAELLEVLDAGGIDVTMPVRTLNTSMQQIVSIARALYRNPKILILDEPTSCLTEAETRSLFNTVNRLRAQGIACLYISHKLDEVFELCDRAVVLRDGRLISEYQREDFGDGSQVIEDIVGCKMEEECTDCVKVLGEEVLRVENFEVPHPFTYGASIIQDVSFSLQKGEILGLCGLVGSGRSELLNAIFGLGEKRAGKVFIKGNEVQIRNPRDAIKYGIGLLTEDRKKNGYVGCLDIKENISLTILKQISRHHLIDKHRQKTIVDRFFQKMKIKAPSAETNILALSGGNQQKVIVAKWLAANPEILFMDEPTRGIDVGTKREIYGLVKELAQQGMSIVVISSEMKELLDVCDRFLVLSKGRVKEIFSRAEIDEAKLLHSCMEL